MFSRYQLSLVFTRPVVGFDQQVDHIAETGGELVLIFHLTGALLNHARHPVGVEMP